MTEVLIGALVGGGVLFVWSAVCWMVLPHHRGDAKSLGAAEGGVADALRQAGTPPGLYVMPCMTDFEKGMKDPALEQRFREGPNALVVTWPPGRPMGAATFLKSFLVDVMQAAGAAAILWIGAPNLDGLVDKVLLLAGIGLLIASAHAMRDSLWWRFPRRNAMTVTLDMIVGFALLGGTLHFVM
ncbi:MAG: hypothetical protein ACE5JG_00355 [Planctomycetota bacterium]